MIPCRILHIVGAMDRAGAETMIMNLYREMDHSKYQFDFVYFGVKTCDFDEEILRLGGRIFQLSSQNPLGRFIQLLKVLFKEQWRVVHSHTLFSSGIHLLAARLAGVEKRICHSHSANSTLTASLAGRIYKWVMIRLIPWVATDHLACGYAAAKNLFPGRKDVTILPNSIDIDHFIDVEESDLESTVRRNEKSLIILQVGRLTDVKNHLRSIQIAQALKYQNIDFKMLFVGNGPNYAAIDDQICNGNLEKNVTLLGLREDIMSLMAVADVLLMPSLYEGFPVVLVESQAAGLPAVISNSISREVDLGIHLVEFMNLEDTSESWAAQIIAVSKRTKVDPAERRRAIESNGFSAKLNADVLASYYQLK